MHRRSLAFVYAAVALTIALAGPDLAVPRAGAEEPAPWAPDRAEPGSVEKIREFTTAPEFLPPSVAYMPDSDRVPSPTEFLGHLAGAPDELTHVERIHAYFRALAAAASDRVRVQPIGTSEEGREMIVAVISSPENLARVERFREIARRLADPRRTSAAEMRALVAEGKPVYYLMGGLHSPETASPETLMELAYRLAVSETPDIRAIRAGVVVLITPVVEVDGREREVDWYYRHLRGRNLPFEDLEDFDSPPYWGKYAFHDNNRDGMQLTLALTRAVNDVYWEWMPQVVHDLHESVPLLYISTGHGPYTRAADPVTVAEWNQFAHHEIGALQAQGLPGVWTWAFWDGWWPGYLFSVANNHNAIGRFYETYGNSMAGTFERKLKDDSYAGKPVTEVQWYRAWPPDKKLRWSLRDNVNYTQAGVLAALGYAALHGPELLENFWAKGERAVRRGGSEKPYAWVFPRAQRDPARLAYLVRQLLLHRIEVHVLDAPFEADGKTWASGSYVVRLDQPYRAAAINFLDRQDFPPDEPHPPYDDVAWTWPLLYGVEGARLDAKGILAAPLHGPIAAPEPVTGGVRGEGSVFLLRDTGQTSLATARVLLGRHAVQAADTSFAAGDTTYPAGSWIVRAPRTALLDVASRLGLDFDAVAAVPDVARHAVDLPRLAVMHTWTSTQDCGWVRYTLDQAQVPYVLIHDGDLRKGNLRGRFDVVLYPNSWGDFARQVHGIDRKYGPLAYTRTAEFPSHGTPDASPDITGGMGFEGLLELQRFVQEGGVLVTLAGGGVLAVDGGLVRDVRRLAPGTVQTPGSEVQAKVLQLRHPLAYGYDELPSVFRGNGPLFEVEEHDRGLVVMQFGTKKVPEEEEAEKGEKEAEKEGEKEQAPPAGTGNGAAMSPPGGAGVKPEAAAAAGATKPDLVLSGFVKPKEKLDGMPAVLDIPVGKGHVVLFAFNPMHRYLNHSDFRFVYNAILNWDDLPAPR
jgi:hypothetical protein